MFDELLEKIKSVDLLESKLLSIFEGKSWEYIAKALYTILDDIDTASDMCKDNYKAYQDVVMKLQAKKNEFLSSDGYTLKPAIEIDGDSEEQPNNSMLQLDEDDSTVGLMRYNATTSECVCHIYGLNDDELLEFYRNTILSPEHYTTVGAQKQYPKDKAEVEEEIEKRSLELPVTESINENLTGHARRELELASMFDKEVEGSEAAGSWNILCAEAVMELMEVFANQGHSGFSASMTQDLFSRLAKYEPLTELTDNSDEWNDISEMQSGEPGWQSQRSPSCFSEDGGKTYWDIDEEYYIREDEDGERYSGGLSEEEWGNRPMHQSKHFEKKE